MQTGGVMYLVQCQGDIGDLGGLGGLVAGCSVSIGVGLGSGGYSG